MFVATEITNVKYSLHVLSDIIYVVIWKMARDPSYTVSQGLKCYRHNEVMHCMIVVLLPELKHQRGMRDV